MRFHLQPFLVLREHADNRNPSRLKQLPRLRPLPLSKARPLQLLLAMIPYQQGPPGPPNEPRRYLAPHPNMYPIPPPNPSFPTQPLLPIDAYQQPPLPAGARFISPPRFPTADDLKYKCSICGRFRSPNYHYRHPIPPGELPKPTVCRKCREAATDSEESDVYEERSPRARSRSVARRARSLSRGAPSRRYARSSSRSAGVRVVEVEERRPPGELVRYVQSRRPETVYVERRSGSSYEDDLYIVSDEEYDCPPRYVIRSRVYSSDIQTTDEHRPRLISRAPTPMPRTVRRKSSDPYLVERREYYDGQNSVIEERIRPSRPVSRASLRSVRVLEAPRVHPYTRREEPHSEEEVHSKPRGRRPVFEEEDWYANRNRGKERSRSRMSTYDDGDDYPARRPSMLRAPSPPSIAAGSSSLGYLDARPYHREEARRGRPAIVASRRRSRSRSVAEPASSFLRPGDNITVVERHTSGDYDTYDRDGMRVRVREI